MDADLSCALFSTQGALLDAAYHASPSALGGCVRHCGSNPVGASNADEDSEVIHAFPALVPEQCCLMVFTAGGIGIQSCSSLSMTVHAKERKKAKVSLTSLRTELRLFDSVVASYNFIVLCRSPLCDAICSIFCLAATLVLLSQCIGQEMVG